jgi:hypothetical protein
VDNGILKIKTTGKKIFDGDKVEVNLVCTDLNSLIVSGAAEVKSESPISYNKLYLKNSGASESVLDINGEDLSVDVSGAAVVKLKGKA